MKSSPKSDDVPKTSESKTPTSARKLVQARLPFKTLGGSEPPLDTTSNNDISTASTTSEIVTPTSAKGRKRKQTLSIDENERAPKMNRRNTNDGDVSVVASGDKLESENDVSVDHKQNVEAESSSITNNTSENSGSNDDDEKRPRAKRSMNTMQTKEPNKSRKSTDSEHFQIKLPMTKKAKKNKMKTKIMADDVVSMDVDDNENDDNDCEIVDADESNVKNTSTTSSDAGAKSEDSDKDSMDAQLNESRLLNESSILNDSNMLDESIDLSDENNPTTPKITPKQLNRRVESEKKLLERKREREERERLKKLERDEKGIFHI